jgi:hypothetical protein
MKETAWPPRPTRTIPRILIMSPAEAFVAFGCTVAFFATPLLALRMWINRPAAREKLRGAGSNPQLEARLERIEHAVDAIALEIERVAEGQRFTTKLLSESNRALPREPDAWPRAGSG